MTTRTDVAFPSGSDTCRAWLYLPDGSDPAPIVVMAHGLGAVKQMRLDAYAQRFADAGYAALVFDYRHFGDSTGEPRQLLDIGLQREDWRAAIDYARTLPGVDSSRVVLWGTSFGGGHVIAVAAGRSDIAAVIAQCPFTDGLASALRIRPRTLPGLLTRVGADLWAAARHRPPVMIATSADPDAPALMNAAGAKTGYLRLLPADAPFHNEVAARVGLRIPLSFPGRAIKKVTVPMLLCVCLEDEVAPAGPTLRYARRAPDAEVKTYPTGHFDIYVGDEFQQAVSDQLEFLNRRVPRAE